MRILYCIDLKECKYVSEINDFWVYGEDINFKEAKVCFVDQFGTTYISEKISYDKVLSCLDAIVKDGYLNLDNIIFEQEDDE